MEDALLIKGGKKLKGTVRLSGAKNVALKTIIASLLFDGPVTLKNIPRINDVLELLHLIRFLGGSVDFVEKNTLVIDGTSITGNRVDFLHGSKVRVSFMFFAPLLYRFKRCYVPNPGGCRIGLRPIDRIIEGMKSLGVDIMYDHKTGYYEAVISNAPKGNYVFKKTSHTGTELLILLSVFGNGTICIENAALEPEIDDLIRFLNEGGAQISRNGKSIKIKGVAKLKQSKPYQIVSDRNEAITFAVLAVATKGDIVLSAIPFDFIETFVEAIQHVGAGFEDKGGGLYRFYYKGPLQASNIETSPYPGFMTDWQQNWAVLMTQAQGESIIHERVFENRFSYVEELRKLGAVIEFIDISVSHPKSYYFFNYEKDTTYQQVIRVHGPQKLHNGVLVIKDLRAGATLAIAGLIAEGETIVNGFSILERGYEDFVGKVRGLGGEITKK